MLKGNKLPLLLFVLALLIGMTFLLESQSASSINMFLDPSTRSSLAPNPTSLLEAWKIVSQYAQGTDNSLQISEIASIDHPEDSKQTGIPGGDGRRRAWLATLLSPVRSKLIRLTIWDSEIVDKTESPVDLQLAAVEKPLLDSPAALIAAITRYKFTPNGNHGIGYHFAVGVNEEGQHVLSVAGGKQADSLINDVVVMFDISASVPFKALMRSFANAGGVLVSQDAGLSWQPSTLVGQMVTAIADDPNQSGWGYAASAGIRNISIYKTIDNGNHWSAVSTLPIEAGIWATSILPIPELGAAKGQKNPTKLFVTTRTGAWYSTDQGNWSHIQTLPNVPIQWTSQINSPKGYRLFASIIDGPQENLGLYDSSDVLHWRKLQAGGIYRLSRSYDSQQVIAIEQQSSQSFRYTFDTDENIILPNTTLNVVGDFEKLDELTLRLPSAVGVMRKVRAGSVDSIDMSTIVTSPYTWNRGIVIGGGFRNGIFRSDTRGQSWSQVLLDPSAIIPGNNEIYAVVFLSENAVIAINGGSLTWEELQ